MKFLFIFSILLITTNVYAQKKLNLDDLEIKGELHGDDRLTILARERLPLKNYVQFRTNFRKEIVEELPEPATGSKEKEQ